MKVYVVGDSISLHYGPYLRDYLAGSIDYSRYEGETHESAADLDKAEGANGGNSRRILKIVKRLAQVGGIDADLVLLNCGLHDIKTDPQTGTRQVPADDYQDNLQKIVHYARQLPSNLVWIRTTPCDERIHNTGNTVFHRFAADGIAYNKIADEVMRVAGVPMIDLYAFTLNLGDGLYCDHVHFNEQVRRQQAAFIAGWLAACASSSVTASPAVATGHRLADDTQGCLKKVRA